MSKTIVLVHGAWLTPASWDRFRGRYEAAGHTVIAPAWPLLDRPVEDLNRAPDPRLHELGIAEIVDHYDRIVRALPEPPILMGHSFGGLFVQLLLDRGLGAAGVAIDPAPPFGVPAHPRAIWSSIDVFTSWNAWNRVLTMSYHAFATTFAQTLPESEKAGTFVQHVVPCPGRLFFQAVLGMGSRVRWDNPARAPLLLVAGRLDRTVPASMVRTNFRRQQRAASVTELREFSGRSHWLCNEAGWEDVADHALTWALAHARPASGVKAPDVLLPVPSAVPSALPASPSHPSHA
jgi:pimeloyl-ACP methyl ester carboxylesterase